MIVILALLMVINILLTIETIIKLKKLDNEVHYLTYSQTRISDNSRMAHEIEDQSFIIH